MRHITEDQPVNGSCPACEADLAQGDNGEFFCLDCGKTIDDPKDQIKILQQAIAEEQKYRDEIAADYYQSVQEVERLRAALLAVKRGVDESFSSNDGCPFCNGYVGFEVDDPVLDEQGDIIGHDNGCPWPLVKLALGENQVYKHKDDEG